MRPDNWSRMRPSLPNWRKFSDGTRWGNFLCLICFPGVYRPHAIWFTYIADGNRAPAFAYYNGGASDGNSNLAAIHSGCFNFPLGARRPSESKALFFMCRDTEATVLKLKPLEYKP